MRELQHQEPPSTIAPPAGAEVPRMRLIDAPAGATVRLGDGRVVVATGVVIQGARFVRPVLSSDGRLGSMEVLQGHQLVVVN